jgi:hypothetical protein
MATNSPALFYRGTPAYGASPSVKLITTAALTSNLVTLTTSANHGLSVIGQIVSVQGVGSSYDGVYAVHSYPALNQFTYVKTASNISSTSVTPNGSATFNTLVTSGGSLASNAVTNYVATVTTSASHGLAVGDIVAVNSGTTGTDTPAAVIIAVPSATTFQYNSSTGTVASASLTQGAFGKYPAVYTLAASTVGIITNLVLANPNLFGSTVFTISAAGTPVVANLTVPAGGTTVIDMKSYLGTTGNTIVIGTTTPTATATISGMTVV